MRKVSGGDKGMVWGIEGVRADLTDDEKLCVIGNKLKGTGEIKRGKCLRGKLVIRGN